MAQTSKDPIIADFEQAESERSNWESLWQDIAELVLPRRDFTTKRSKGTPRQNRVFDSTAQWAAGQLAAGLQSFLVNPRTRWFDLRVEGLNEEDREAKLWLSQVRDQMFGVFNDPEANFYPAFHEGALDISSFGTMSMFIGAENKIKFKAMPLSEAYIREDHNGRVNTYYRKFQMTTRQARDFYGEENLPPSLRREIGRNQMNREHDFLQAVVPRDSVDPKRGRRKDNKPWRSIHYMLPKGEKISEGGFDRFPFLVPRWNKVAGETYGRSPAMEVLPDIKMLQEMSKTVIKAAQKATDPPLLVEDDGVLNPVRTMPGGLNYVRNTAGKQEAIRPLNNQARIDIGQDLIQERQNTVLRAFFVQALQGILLRGDSSPLKATEVAARQQQALRALAPVVARFQSEFLEPLIDQVFTLMLQRGELPEPPESLRGRDLSIEFISQASTAQQSQQLDNTMAWLEGILPILNIDPSASANIDTDNVIRQAATFQNVPTEMLTDPETVRQVRQENSRVQQAQELAGLLKEGGQGVASLSTAAETLGETQERDNE